MTMRSILTRPEWLESRQMMAGDIAGVFGAATSLVEDLNPRTTTRITSAVQLDDRLIVAALDGTGDVDLWSVDANSASHVVGVEADFRLEGVDGARGLFGCCRLTRVGDSVYLPVHFVEGNAGQSFVDVSGRTEIWRTDGTLEGSNSLGDVNGYGWWGDGIRIHDRIMGHDGQLLVAVTEWWSDEATTNFWTPNESGTLEQYGMSFNMNFNLPLRDLIHFDGHWYFLAGNGDTGYGFFRTNPETREMFHLASFSGSQVFGDGPYELTIFNNDIYFSDGYFGLWKFDSTEQGTFLVKDLHPDVSGDIASENGPLALTSTPEGLLFQTQTKTAPDLHTEYHNWISDGTSEGTMQLDASDPRSSWQAAWTVSTDDQLKGNRPFFGGPQGSINRHLLDLDSVRKVQGDSVVITQQEDLLFFEVEGIRPFGARQPDVSLWVTDGAVDRPHELGTNLEVIGSLDDQVILARDNQLLTVDQESLSLATFNEVPSTMTMDSIPLGLTASDEGAFFFAAHDRTVRFVSDDNGATSTIWETELEFANGVSPDSRLVAVQPMNSQVFTGLSSGLYVTDTESGETERLAEFNSTDWNNQFIGTTTSDGLVYVVRHDRRHGIEVWESDGTTDGTRLFASLSADDSRELFSRNSSSPVVIDDSVFFAIGGATLDGFGSATPGTLFEANSDGTINQLKSHVHGMTQRGDELLYLRQANTTDALKLWAWSVSGETELLSIDVDVEIGFPTEIVADDDPIYFADGSGGLWASDSTQEKNTVRLASFDSAISDLVLADGLLFFVADDGVHGREVWKSDGTADGTQLAADVRSGDLGSSPAELTISGNAIYFTADNGESGNELWKINLPLVVDIDMDGLVGFSDFLILSQNYQSEAVDGVLSGDLNDDGFVDFSDFLLLSANFGNRM